MISLKELLFCPDIFPEKIDLHQKILHCCRMSRESYAASAFLDHRIVTENEEKYIFSFSDAGQITNPSGRCDFVFHNAFCCSTLFSRCIAGKDLIMVLREPNVLLELASIYRYMGTQLLPEVNASLLENLSALLNALMARKYHEHSAVVIKPSDACNNMMISLLEENHENTCLLMYSDMERFLTAVFKVPERREWVRIRANELSLDEFKQNGNLRVAPNTLNDIELAALVWVLHMEKFRELLRIYGADRVRVMDSESFMGNQMKAVAAYLHFIGQDKHTEDVIGIIGNVTQTHSKSSELDYDYSQRESDYRCQRKIYAQEVDKAMNWASAVFGRDALTGLEETGLGLVDE